MRRVLATTTFLLVGLAACGGGSDRLSADEFRERADALCKEADEAIEALDEPTSVDDADEFFAATKAEFEELISGLKDLTPPEDLEEDYLEAINLLEDQSEVLDDLAQAVADEDDAAGQDAIERGDEIDAELDQLGSELGLSECGNDDEDGDTDEPGDDGGNDGGLGLGPDEEFPVVREPTVAEIDLFVPLLKQGIESEAGVTLTDEEATCMARYALSRGTLEELGGPFGEAVGEGAAFECLSIDRLIEIGMNVSG